MVDLDRQNIIEIFLLLDMKYYSAIDSSCGHIQGLMVHRVCGLFFLDAEI